MLMDCELCRDEKALFGDDNAFVPCSAVVPSPATDRIRNISLMLFNRSISVSLSFNLSRKSSHSAFQRLILPSFGRLPRVLVYVGSRHKPESLPAPRTRSITAPLFPKHPRSADYARDVIAKRK